MGKPSRFRHDSLADVREFPVRDFEKHLIFYRPGSTGINQRFNTAFSFCRITA